MPTNENKKQYDMQYAQKNLKRIPLNVQKEKYAEIQKAAQSVGESVNGYIKKAIDERMERTNAAPDTADIVQEALTPPRNQEKHYKPFTEADAGRVDLKRLLSDIHYQLEVGTDYGSDVLREQMEKARQQEAESPDAE